MVSQCIRTVQVFERRNSARQVGVLSGAAAGDSGRKNIGLSKLSSDSTLYRKVAERRVSFLSNMSILERTQ